LLNTPFSQQPALSVNVKSHFDEQGDFMTKQTSLLLFASALLAMLTGCATISEDSCRHDSWRDIGFDAAMRNHGHADHVSDVTKICGKLGITVDYDQYEDGFGEGTRAFCDPANGFNWGRKGKSYNGVCANPQFSAAYNEGYDIYRIEQRHIAIRSRLGSIRDRLANITARLDEDRTLSDEQRNKLLREFDNLLLERRDLLSEQRALPIV
jgi:hypothetical protein